MAAKLPDALEPRQIPSPVRGVLTLRPNLQQGTQGLAEGVAAAGLSIQRVADEQQRVQTAYDVARAETELTKSHITAMNAMTGDDFTQYAPSYQKTMSTARDNALKLISNPIAKADFGARADNMIARGYGQALDKARAKEGDLGRASLINDVTELTDLGLGSLSEADRTTALTSIRGRIATAEAAGYIDAQQAAEMSRKISVDYVTKSFEMLPPQQRIEALSKKVTDQTSPSAVLVNALPPDVKETLLERAQAELLAQARQAKELHDQQVEQDMTDAGNIIFSEKGANGVTSIPPMKFAQFSPAQKKSLIDFAKGLQEGIKTDPTRYVPLLDMASKNPSEFLNRTSGDQMALMRPHLEDRDYQHILSVREGLLNKDSNTQDQLADYRTSGQVVSQTLATLGMNEKDNPKEYAQFSYEFAQAAARQKQILGRDKLTPDENQKIVDDLVRTAQVPRSVLNPLGWSWMGAPMGATKEGPAVGTINIDNVPDDEQQKIKDEFARYGAVPTTQQIIQAYIRKLDKAAQQ